ncbi:MAG: DEAD/DEAH box helicase family protein [Hydrotalea sp.]|nr:DEAD/DEAH box helicase family protein [Hydrotalea sp.]
MQLKDYQNNAVRQLLEKSGKLLTLDGNQSLLFKSPTGSGKTIMMAEFLKQLHQYSEVPLSFIWLAPRKLHIQSREKLEKYYEDTRALECKFFEELTDRKIADGEILFENWESINRKGNTIMIENEQDMYLSKVLENTREDGNQIILIIDEGHHTAGSEISINLKEDLAPKLTIDITATPKKTDSQSVLIEVEDVQKEAMIKKSVVINQGWDSEIKSGKIQSKFANGETEAVISEALKKQQEIKKEFAKLGKDINPLVLIQIPNEKKIESNDLYKEIVNKVLDNKFNINEANDKLAIYLSDEKINLEKIIENNNEVEVMIFKQAIALGWDCPRAHILVLFRTWHDGKFAVQTAGRIMRMPEPDNGKYYGNELLDNAYIYTNLEQIDLVDSTAQAYYRIFTSQRIDDYKDLRLSTVYPKRFRERTRLSAEFIKIFMTTAMTNKIAEKIKTKNQKAQRLLITDFQIRGIGDLTNKKIVGDGAIDITSPDDMQKKIDAFSAYSLRPEFYPEERSVNRVKSSIYEFFIKFLDIDYKLDNKVLDIGNILLSHDNLHEFKKLIDKAKHEYLNRVEKIPPGIVAPELWEVPENYNYEMTFKKSDYKKSVLMPFYYLEGWKTELKFIEFLEKEKSVKWWFKNGTSDGTFFAVPYDSQNGQRAFYVDFLVLFVDRRIGLFDTKSGWTIDDAKEKSDGLLKYIADKKSEGREIFGGIVTNTDQKTYDGAWKIYQGQSKNLNKNDLSNWELLEF